MNSIRCLAISNSYPPDHAGGYELGACNILENLALHCDWKNTVLSSVRRNKSPKTDGLELTGFFPGKLGPEIELWKTRRSLLKHHQSILARMVEKAEAADLIFVFNPRRLIYPQWTSILKLGKPVITFISDHWPNDPRSSDIFHLRSKKDELGRLRDASVQAIYDTAPNEDALFESFAGVMFGSRFLQQKQAEIFEANSQQEVIHWGIDIGRFPKVEFSPNRLKTFGFCGRPEKEKGLDLALSAIRELASKDDKIRLLVASDLKGTAYGRGILKQVKEDAVLRSQVDFLGQVPHAELHARFYSQIGTMIFPSIWEEPFALTVLEAMSSGALVIGSSTGGTPEVVNNATGYLFDPHQPDALGRVCEEALAASDSINRSKVEAGSRCIIEDHTLERMAKRVDEFVRNLLF